MMAEVLFIIIALVYAVVAIKVDQWFTISRLGFKLETPPAFLRDSTIYHNARMVLFGGAVIALFFTSAIPWYVGMGGLFVLWLGAFWIGRKLAFNAYRQVYREMIEDEDRLKISDPAQYSEILGDEDPSTHRAELENGARRTDRELAEMVERSVKWGL